MRTLPQMLEEFWVVYFTLWKCVLLLVLLPLAYLAFRLNAVLGGLLQMTKDWEPACPSVFVHIKREAESEV